MTRSGTRWGVVLLIAFAVATPVVAGGFLRKLVRGTVNKLMVTILPPGEVNPSNIAVVDGDMMVANMMDQRAAGQLRAREAHESATGHGVVVAVLDAGFDLSHPVLEGRLSPHGWDALDGDYDVDDTGNGYDDYGDGTPDNAVGHGNFVAGMVLIAAPEATILPIRIMDDEGYGSNQSILRGIDHAMSMGAHVINISAQAAFLNDWSVRNRLQEARDMGIVVVASAGNAGQEDLGAIAGHDTTVSTGAVDDDARLADFSNTAGWNQDLVVVAPGVNLVGPMARGDMGVWSGTSFSTGFTTGAAALYLQRRPGSSPAEVMDTIRASTNPAYDRDGNVYSTWMLDLAQVATR